MNNPNFQNQQYGENQRGSGRTRDQSLNAEDRGGRPSWREDEQNSFRNRSAWGEQNENTQARYAPRFDSFNENFAQDRQAGQSRDYDEYSYGSGQRQRAWSNNDVANYGNDYSNESPGNAQSRSTYGGESSRWSQGRDVGDSGNFGFRSAYGQQYGADQGRGEYGRGSSPWGQPGQRNQWGQANPSRQSLGSQAAQWSGPTAQSTGAYGLQEQNHRGKGPKGYVRTDERIREEICECLSDDARIDASEVSVEVRGGVVMLEGSVQDRSQKHRIEDIADSCSGVKDVHNSLRVTASSNSSLSTSSNQSDQAETSTLSQRTTDMSAKQTKQ